MSTLKQYTQWEGLAREYAQLVGDQSKDASYLREHGLLPLIESMTGDGRRSPVLDVGTGTGWLLDMLDPACGHGCDLVKYEEFPEKWRFQQCDARDLLYEDNAFVLTVCSLVLMWMQEYKLAIKEMARVTKSRGLVLIVLMQPYFYRTGQVNKDDSFAVDRDLSKPFEIAAHRIAEEIGPFSYYYRPMPDYLNACIKAGLRIEEVADWHLDLDDYIKRFGSPQQGAIRRTGKVPMYSFIKCRKE